MTEEKIDWKSFRETKEVIVEYDVNQIKYEIQSLKKEVEKRENLLKLAKKAGIDPDNMVAPIPEPVIVPIVEPQPEIMP